MPRRNADPVGAFTDTIKEMAPRSLDPVWGTYTTSPAVVTLDSGQVIPDPATLCGTPSNNGRVLCFFLQGGHDVAIVALAEEEDDVNL